MGGITMKKYIKPTIKILESKMEILATISNTGGYCNSNCKIWHICQDRLEDTYCKDKRL